MRMIGMRRIEDGMMEEEEKMSLEYK